MISHGFQFLCKVSSPYLTWFLNNMLVETEQQQQQQKNSLQILIILGTGVFFTRGIRLKCQKWDLNAIESI